MKRKIPFILKVKIKTDCIWLIKQHSILKDSQIAKLVVLQKFGKNNLRTKLLEIITI